MTFKSKHSHLVIIGILAISLIACKDSIAAPPVPAAATNSSSAVSTTTEASALSSPGNVTLDFKDADIRNVLRIISLKSGVNIVTGAEVTGPVTIRLVDVPWEKALEVVLKTYGFAYERDGNIIRVTTLGNLELEALETEVFPLVYADATEVQETLQEMLSDRGSIRADERTNLVIVTDVPTNVFRIKQVIDRLDRGIPQVLIEAKIVELTVTDAERLGVKWNASLDIRGSSTPTTFPFNANRSTELLNRYLPRGKPGGSTIPIADDGTTTSSVVIEDPEDFPSVFRRHDDGSLKGSTAGVFPFASPEDFAFGKIDFSQFQVLLEAIKNSGHNKVLSEPRITVLSNQEAKILVGEEIYIPNYERNTETGQMEITGYVPRSLGIEMNVLPQVNHKKQVNMALTPSISNLIGFEELTPDVRVPRIAIRNAETQVRVSSGDTIVLGGLIKEDIVDDKTKFPILGDLPLLDRLFSYTDKTVIKTDLMFFITVTVLDEPGIIGIHDTQETS